MRYLNARHSHEVRLREGDLTVPIPPIEPIPAPYSDPVLAVEVGRLVATGNSRRRRAVGRRRGLPAAHQPASGEWHPCPGPLCNETQSAYTIIREGTPTSSTATSTDDAGAVYFVDNNGTRHWARDWYTVERLEEIGHRFVGWYLNGEHVRSLGEGHWEGLMLARWRVHNRVVRASDGTAYFVTNDDRWHWIKDGSIYGTSFGSTGWPARGVGNTSTPSAGGVLVRGGAWSTVCTPTSRNVVPKALRLLSKDITVASPFLSESIATSSWDWGHGCSGLP